MAGSVDAAALAALGQVDFNHACDPETIWADTQGHVPELNGNVSRQLLDGFVRRTRPGTTASPIGWAVIGPAGAGKTHMLGTLRQDIWDRGGWFVLLDLLDVNDFWATAVLGFVHSLARPMQDDNSQGAVLFDRLCARTGLSPGMKARLAGPRREACHEVAGELTAALRREDFLGTSANRDVVHAFVSLLSGDADLPDLAQAWLIGTDVEQSGKAALGVMQMSIRPRLALKGLSWLMALCGPTLCALDQIDSIVSVAHLTAGSGTSPEDPVRNRALAVIDELAGGMMDLREVSRRSVTVVTTLETTWAAMCRLAVSTFRDRFDIVRLEHISSPEAARGLVEKRLAAAYGLGGFAPDYPSWPFHPEAFSGASQFTPRQLLQACSAHVEGCMAVGAPKELLTFPNGAPDTGTVTVKAPPVSFPEIEARYAALCAEPPPSGLVGPGKDDGPMAGLLLAALRALVRQTVLPPGDDLTVENDTPGLHARLRHVANADGGRERHHCFRALPFPSAIAVQTRLQAAVTASGIDRNLPFRHLIVLRDGPWPGGKRMAETAREFDVRGGKVLAPDVHDLSRFAALKTLLAEAPSGLDGWLRARRPLAESAFFRALGLAADEVHAQGKEGDGDVPPGGHVGRKEPASRDQASAGSEIPLGLRTSDRQPVLLRLAMLPRHVAVIAGAGSGKTVFLRRLVEEAALAGVPSILLDSNNDLVRLADRWPERPPEFTDGDAGKADRFAREAEVVVWTPGRARGNPLVLAPLPDFAALGDDEERDMAVAMAAATLGKLISSGGQKGKLRAGVLTGALRHFARNGGGRLPDLVALLRDLPPDASPIDDAQKFGTEAANTLLAAMECNPLLDGEGVAMDPAVLLGGTPGRVRVSVVNLAGLPGDEARQDFVARLLMALFGHIRRHPAGPGRPAAGLLVMDEAQNFAPSGRSTPSGEATVSLVRQARKYGLGMVFATQGPKAINTNIINNCRTQMFGLTNASAALTAVREVLRSRGGGGDDLGRLQPGQFYITGEDFPKSQKLSTPMCLTYHPPNPPSEDEVIGLAAKSRTVVDNAG